MTKIKFWISNARAWEVNYPTLAKGWQGWVTGRLGCQREGWGALNFTFLLVYFFLTSWTV
jgi:hypothetical protein